MRRTLGSLLALLLGGCSTGALRCDKPFDVWADEDKDGFGAEHIGLSCEVEPGQAKRPLDCDDTNDKIHPDVEESCDGIDNDCDGKPDNGLELKTWYADLDADGYGAQFPSQLACEKPDEGWSIESGDCDDSDPGRHPDAMEICGGYDEDCDGFEGDYDDSVDPDTFETFYVDRDGDGYGTISNTESHCQLQTGLASNSLDCNDNNKLIGQYRFFNDADGDGFGDPSEMTLSCTAPANMVPNNLDCDDADEIYNVEVLWFIDNDLDGYGGQAPLAYQCKPPVPEATTDNADCDDTRDDIHPGVEGDICLDGIDMDCNNSDSCRSCLEQRTAVPDSPSGVYDIAPRGINASVWCDMETDGGGWTLVASSAYPLYDQAGNHHTDLDTLNPTGYHPAIWSALRSVVDENSDIRFACKRLDDTSVMAVDLSFYNTPWYSEFASSNSDSQSCFNENNGVGDDPPPARRNNLTDEYLPEGDPWNASGYLEGEDNCGSYDDFTIDFDDRGLNGNESDGTDWGYDDYTQKCGYANTAGQWFIFIREL